MQNLNQFFTGKAKFDVHVLDIDSETTLPQSPFAANLSYIEPSRRTMIEQFKPSLNIANLVVLRQGFEFTNVGVTVYVADDENTPAGITEFWPLSEHVPAFKLSSKGERPICHAFRAESDQFNLTCFLRRMPQMLADQVRQDIALAVPDNIRQIFWSESEIAQIEANAVAQQRYEKLAQELIDSLYE